MKHLLTVLTWRICRVGGVSSVAVPRCTDLKNMQSGKSILCSSTQVYIPKNSASDRLACRFCISKVNTSHWKYYPATVCKLKIKKDNFQTKNAALFRLNRSAFHLHCFPSDLQKQIDTGIYTSSIKSALNVNKPIGKHNRKFGSGSNIKYKCFRSTTLRRGIDYRFSA
jgi:hypothetical protein